LIRLPVVLTALTFAMAGCQVPPREMSARQPPHGEAGSVQSLNDQDLALRFYARVRNMNAADLQRVRQSARKNFETDPTELHRIEFALTLSVPVSGFHDENAAVDLLEYFLKTERSALRPLAILLHSDLTERRRLEEAVQQLSSKLKDEQKRADSAQQKTDGLQQKAEALQQRIDDLQQKLDALLDMEMKMMEREQPTPPKRKQP
jgi:flagellar capping protein FliD